jgi:hypothetical protein
VAKVRSPADAVAMIPYLLGFEPADSLVVVSLGGSRNRFGPIVRGDLAGPGRLREPAQLADFLAAAVGSRGYRAVLVVAYSSDPDAAGQAVSALLGRLAETGVAVREALRADGARWWSYTCDRECCPPQGRPYDPTTSAAAALAVTMGLAKEPSREALADQFEPLPPAERAAVGVEARGVWVATTERGPDWRRLDDLIEASLASDATARESVAVLLGAVQQLDARDVAWALMSRDAATRHFELWRRVMRSADDDLMAPAGVLCAFAAWLSGSGAVAATACDRVAEVAPGYRFLGLVRDILARGLSPDRWDGFRGPLAAMALDISVRRPAAGAVGGDGAG